MFDLNAPEFMVVWEAVAEYVERRRGAIDDGASGLDEKLAVAERVLERFDLVISGLEASHGG